MPTYEYYCDENEQKVEVRHSMREEIANWGELCSKAGIENGSTSKDTPVRRLISGGLAIPQKSKGNTDPVQSCSSGSCGCC